MGAALWIVQILLALLFLGAGLNKSIQTKKSLARMMKWPALVPAAVIKLIALSELCGAAGLVLPGLTHDAVVLTPLAACGLGLEMLGAAAVHLRLGEKGFVIGTLIIAVLCAIVAWGRFVVAPL